MELVKVENKLSEYYGKKVFVTGADGFLGSHLIEKLVELGAEPIAFVRGTSQNNSTTYPVLKNLKENSIKIEYGDMASADIIRILLDNDPDFVFHLGAMAHVDYSFRHPVEVFNANALSTLYILEALRSSSQQIKGIFTSSSEVYGTNLTDKPMTEEHPLNPATPYAASKVAADRLVFSYFQTYNMPVYIIRPFNFFGPRLIYDVVPKFIQLALKNEPLTIHGDGEQSRDLTYVTDTVEAFLLLGLSKHFADPINIGTGRDISINYIAQKVRELIPWSKSGIVYEDDRLGQVKQLITSNKKAKDLLGWQPKVRFEDGLLRTTNYWIEKINGRLK